MKMTTLCYIEKDGKYLMLHRTKKQHDISPLTFQCLKAHIQQKAEIPAVKD